MTLLTDKPSKLFFAKAIRVVVLALLAVVFASSATLAQNQQVPFTATAAGNGHRLDEAGGLTQISFSGSGSATHLGDFTGALTCLQDNQGNFGSTAAIVGANGKDSIFFSISGTFEGGNGGNKCVFTSTGAYTITGGAEAFVNATGSGTLTTQFDLCAGTATGTYTGTVSQPNSN